MPKYFKYTTPKSVAYTALGFEPNSITIDFAAQRAHISFDELDQVDGLPVILEADKVITLNTSEVLGLFTGAQLSLLRDKSVQAIKDRTGDTGADEG